MAEPDYYGLIGVEKNASLHEIRSKFRAKVLAEHPDKGGDPKKFQLLNKAYNVLTDQEKRRRYDATGHAEKSAEEEFVEGFGGGRLHFEPRSKEADDRAIVSLQDRIITGPQTHEEGFAEWLRQRDQASMVLTDKDFMKSHLFNSAELAAKINHPGPVQHVLGSPKTDAYGQALGGAIQVQVKPRPLKKTIDHDEVLVRMLAVPVDNTMVYADLNKTGVCLGMCGIGRLEQVGTRVEDLKNEDWVLVLPKPTKYTPDRPVGTARTLMLCNEEDVIPIPSDIADELSPEQLCLTPTIVASYMLLEIHASKLKPGDSVLLNGAHMSAQGSSLLQLCKLLKLKPLCMLGLPGAPPHLVKGEYGTKAAWEEAVANQIHPPAIRAQYERISEWLVTMGAEEVFPDAVSLLKWRDRNQRMLPKVALDGVSTKESCEQLIHCLQPGDKDSQLIVYGHGVAQPIQINANLLSAWGGQIIGFNIHRWVHSLSANQKKMMAVMENITKLIRANKFLVDTVLYKVGEDAITDAFSRAGDPADNAQVVLIFPSLQEEVAMAQEGQKLEKQKAASQRQQEEDEKRNTEETEKLKRNWLEMLFGPDSVAAMSPEGPLPINSEAGNRENPSMLFVWIGDKPAEEAAVLQELPRDLGNACLISLAWTQHPAGEGLLEFSLSQPEVTDGSWYVREKASFENQDLDLLHDVELLGRSMVETVQKKLESMRLSWSNVVILGFGKGAGVALYAALLQLIAEKINSMVLFNPVALFPTYLGEKVMSMRKAGASPSLKIFSVWGNKCKPTPGNYRQLLAQLLRKAPEVHNTPDSLPDADFTFDGRCLQTLQGLLPLILGKK